MSDEGSSSERRPYAAPGIRLVELDVMASFPDNCKTDMVGAGGFGGSVGVLDCWHEPTEPPKPPAPTSILQVSGKLAITSSSTRRIFGGS